MKKKQKSIKVLILLNEEINTKMKIEAAFLGMTKAELIEKIVNDYANKLKHKIK